MATGQSVWPPIGRRERGGGRAGEREEERERKGERGRLAYTVSIPYSHSETHSVTHLEEVLDSLWVIAVAFSADSLHFLHLTSLTGSLDEKKIKIE